MAMIKSSALKLIIFFTCASLLFSCLKRDNYPTTPVIEFKDVQLFGGDSLDISFSFKDGDGDIGEEKESGTIPHNVFMLYLYKDTLSGKFEPEFNNCPGSCDTLYESAILPYLTPRGQNKVLDGEIRVMILAPYGKYAEHKTIKYKVYIRDRAGNQSNTIETSEIHLP